MRLITTKLYTSNAVHCNTTFTVVLLVSTYVTPSLQSDASLTLHSWYSKYDVASASYTYNSLGTYGSTTPT